MNATTKGFVSGAAAVVLTLFFGFGGGVLVADWLNDTSAKSNRVERVQNERSSTVRSEASSHTQPASDPEPKKVATQSIPALETALPLSKHPMGPPQTLAPAQQPATAPIRSRVATGSIGGSGAEHLTEPAQANGHNRDADNRLKARREARERRKAVQPQARELARQNPKGSRENNRKVDEDNDAATPSVAQQSRRQSDVAQRRAEYDEVDVPATPPRLFGLFGL
jgi:hypothetical protein